MKFQHLYKYKSTLYLLIAFTLLFLKISQLNTLNTYLKSQSIQLHHLHTQLQTHLRKTPSTKSLFKHLKTLATHPIQKKNLIKLIYNPSNTTITELILSLIPFTPHIQEFHINAIGHTLELKLPSR